MHRRRHAASNPAWLTHLIPHRRARRRAATEGRTLPLLVRGRERLRGRVCAANGPGRRHPASTTQMDPGLADIAGECHHAVVRDLRSIDLVIPTLGRTDVLERLLRSVAAQTWQGVTRVLVIDQNPDDRLVPVLEVERDRVSVQHLRSEPGTSRACNVGFRQATADIVVRGDDDCWYPPD